jgi:phosphonoacetate hydrolase
MAKVHLGLLLCPALLAWACDDAAANHDGDDGSDVPGDVPAETAPDAGDGTSDVEADADAPPPPAIVILGVDSTWGDVQLRFALQPADGRDRTVSVAYSGACAETVWVDALTSDPGEPLAPGEHQLTWYSWDQEAGCSGAVRLRLTADPGENAESAPFELDNTGDHSGFALFPQEDQGISGEELAAFGTAMEALVADPNTDFVATRLEDVYAVYAARGTVAFQRRPSRLGWVYEELAVEGTNPLARQDPEWAPTLEEELALGGNPNAVELPALGYGPGDWRITFTEPENDSYPYAYERIAAFFDHPDSADFMVNPKGYARYDGAPGEHGSLGIVQSRTPLLLWGRGIRPGASNEHARQVDLAPTLAAVLGMPTTFGIDERGIWSRFVRLQWQDGHALDSILTGDNADHVIVVVADGLTHTELLEKIDTDPISVPNLARMKNEGAWMRFGSIANWPSVTYPSHNVVGAGVWSGHHGLVDNSYYLRGTSEVAAPITQTFNTERFFNPLYGPAETLHMALHRAEGLWEPGLTTGAYTATLYDPSVKDADTADLERRDRTGRVPFPPLGISWPSEIPGPEALLGTTVAGEQLVEQVGMVELYHLYTDGVCPLPRYIIMNFPTTDGAGHDVGPHGDLMDAVLEHIDRQFGVLFGWLEAWGILDRTVIVFTSDHGMQLGDPTRSGDPLAVLDAIGLPHVQ